MNQHRDSAASYIGHYNLLDYFALVENETRARTKFNLLEVTEDSSSFFGMLFLLQLTLTHLEDLFFFIGS